LFLLEKKYKDSDGIQVLLLFAFLFAYYDQSIQADLIWTGNWVQISFWLFVTSCIRTPTLILGYDDWIGRATFSLCRAPAAAGQTRPQLPHASFGFRGKGILTIPITPDN
jgi:hypothetical protein